MRITSSTLSSSATPLPSMQAAPSGGSFQSVLAHASTDRPVDARSTTEGAKDARAGKPEAHSIDEPAEATASGTAGDDEGTEAGAATLPNVGAATANLAGAEPSTVPAPPVGTATAGATPSQAVVPSSVTYVQPGIPVGPVLLVGPEKVGSETAAVADTDSGTVRVPAKQDRSKSQPDVKTLTTQATAAVPVVDQSRIPAVNSLNGQVLAHGQQSQDVPANTAKVAAPESTARVQGKPATAVEGGAEVTAAPPVVSSGAAGSEAGAVVQVPSGLMEAGFESLILPSVAVPAAMGNASGVAALSKPIERGAAAVDDSRTAKVGVGVSSVDGTLSGPGQSFVHTGATGNQPPPSVAQDPSKLTNATAVRTAQDAGLQGAVPVSMHDGAAAQRATAAAPEPVHPAKAENLPAAAHLGAGETVASSGINSAKMIQTMSETEMHVGMHSEEFGDISIRTSLSQQQMVTQISLAHNDLSQAISTHLSTVQAKLGEEYGMHSLIEVNNQGSPLSGGQENSQPRDQQAFAHSTKASTGVFPEMRESSPGIVALTSTGSGHGLDIRV